MKKNPDLKDCPIELHVIENAKVDLDSTRNMAECEKIIEKIREIIDDDEITNIGTPCTIGIVSPFRGQVELIKKALYQVFPYDTIKKHRIEAGTAHTFQGDERDYMLLSLTLAPNSHHQSIFFAQKPNLFNVAISRAKNRLICYISRPPESIPAGILRDYLEHISTVNRQLSAPAEEIEDPMHKELVELLQNEGIEVTCNTEIGGYPVSFLISKGRKSLILETAGFEEKPHRL